MMNYWCTSAEARIILIFLMITYQVALDVDSNIYDYFDEI